MKKKKSRQKQTSPLRRLVLLAFSARASSAAAHAGRVTALFLAASFASAAVTNAATAAAASYVASVAFESLDALEPRRARGPPPVPRGARGVAVPSAVHGTSVSGSLANVDRVSSRAHAALRRNITPAFRTRPTVSSGAFRGPAVARVGGDAPRGVRARASSNRRASSGERGRIHETAERLVHARDGVRRPPRRARRPRGLSATAQAQTPSASRCVVVSSDRSRTSSGSAPRTRRRSRVWTTRAARERQAGVHAVHLRQLLGCRNPPSPRRAGPQARRRGSSRRRKAKAGRARPTS